ncbi:MAG TPA: CBS domain-containing protein [Acidimicrobiales bacterium]|nr:CBS domain-containing protein [Acidimicrobiales bacterium]
MLKDLATCPAVTCPAAATVADAAEAMAEANVGFLVVVDDADKPVGVVTDRDIVIRAVARRREDGAVADVMTPHPASVREDDTVTRAAEVMADRQCRRLALIDAEGTIVGVLSLDDLLREAGDELGEISRAVRGTKQSRLDLP